MGRAGTKKAATRRLLPRLTALGDLQDVAVALDAEDIALARLQAQLRKSEAIQAPSRSDPNAPRRVTLRLPGPLLERLRARSRRDDTTLSNLVAKAVERFLRST